MIHATALTRPARAAPRPAITLELADALAVLARHVAFVQAGVRQGANPVAMDLVDADIERVVAAAGLARRADDHGDDWAERDGVPVMWLGHRADLAVSAVRP